jgi:hypothetical protein
MAMAFATALYGFWTANICDYKLPEWVEATQAEEENDIRQELLILKYLHPFLDISVYMCVIKY